MASSKKVACAFRTSLFALVEEDNKEVLLLALSMSELRGRVWTFSICLEFSIHMVGVF